MKKTNLCIAVALAAALSSPVLSPAEDKPMMGGGMMGQGKMSSMYPKMMEQRKEMMDSMMAMMKQTMGILKDLNHTPSADQKKKLEEMMSNLDDMIKKHDAMHDDMMKQMKERKDSKGK